MLLGVLILFFAAAALIVAVATLATLHRLAHPPRVSYGAALARRLPVSPDDVGLPFVERELRASDGTPISVWIIQPSHDAASTPVDAVPAPPRPVLVLTHGWADSRYGVLSLTQFLAPLFDAIVLHDLRGHGDSPHQRCTLGETEIDDLIAIVDQVDDQRHPIVLMGASMGAGISIVAAARLGQRIAGVIGDSAYRLPMEPIVSFFRQCGYPPYPVLWFVHAHLWFWNRASRCFDRADHARRLACPLLLLHGVNDPICPLASARAIAHAASQGTLIEFPQSAHLDLATTDPGRYLEAVRAAVHNMTKPEPERATR